MISLLVATLAAAVLLLDAPASAQGLGCLTDSLPAVLFDSTPPLNVQTARLATFAEARDILVNGTKVGSLYFDPVNRVGEFMIAKPAAGADAPAEEAAAVAALDPSTLLGRTITNLTTWDGVPAILAAYTWQVGSDVKVQVNQAVTRLLGNPAGLTGLFPDTAGAPGPHALRLGIVRRADGRAIITGVLARTADLDPRLEGRLRDFVNGTGVGDVFDSTGIVCDRLVTGPPPKVDFLWVIDNSFSMGDDQEALAAASQHFTNALATSGLDFRVAVAYTDSYRAPSATPQADTCPGAPGPGKQRVCPFTRDLDALENGTPQCAYFRPGNCGDTLERGFAAARKAIDHFLAGGGCEPVPFGECFIRDGATLVVVFFTDTGEQTSTPPPGQATNSVQSWAQYFSDYNLAAPGTQRAIVHAILCPLRSFPFCSDNNTNSALYDRYSSLIGLMTGIEGSIRESDRSQLPDTIASIAHAVGSSTSGYQLTRPPISSTLRVVLAGPQGAAEVPRDTENGFEYDAVTRQISLRGSFVAAGAGLDLIVSYRHWVDGAGSDLTVTVGGSGAGRVTSIPAGIDCGSDCAERYATGASMRLFANAAPGSIFTGWTGAGCTFANPCAFRIETDTAVAATFELFPADFLTVAVNQAYFSARDTLSISVSVRNPGITAAVDFYLGALLPDGDTIVFITNGGLGVAVGHVSDLTSLHPIASSVWLGTPFAVNLPGFLVYTRTGSEQSGPYQLFLAALVAGSLVDGALGPADLLALSVAPFAFGP